MEQDYTSPIEAGEAILNKSMSGVDLRHSSRDQSSSKKIPPEKLQERDGSKRYLEEQVSSKYGSTPKNSISELGYLFR